MEGLPARAEIDAHWRRSHAPSTRARVSNSKKRSATHHRRTISPWPRWNFLYGHQATPAEVIPCASFFFNGGTVFKPMKKALELVDGYLGYLGAKLSALPLVTSPYYSKHVARKLGAGHSPLGALCNVTLQRSCEHGLFSHSHSPLGSLFNVTRNPLWRVTTCDVALRHKNDTAPYKELSQKGILCI
jgi:hypothetical protein